MSNWLATFSCLGVADPADRLSLPPDWPKIKPELRALFNANAQCLRLYEIYFRQEDDSFGHIVYASYLPNSGLEAGQEAIDGLIVTLRDTVRPRLKGLELREREEHDSQEVATIWSPDDNSYNVEVGTRDFLPSVCVTEFCNDLDLTSFLESSPLKDLARLSRNVWEIDYISCGRAAGSSPSIHIQATNAKPALFSALANHGFEERDHVWWKGSIAIQSDSNGGCFVSVPAPSFISGAQRDN